MQITYLTFEHINGILTYFQQGNANLSDVGLLYIIHLPETEKQIGRCNNDITVIHKISRLITGNNNRFLGEEACCKTNRYAHTRDDIYHFHIVMG